MRTNRTKSKDSKTAENKNANNAMSDVKAPDRIKERHITKPKVFTDSHDQKEPTSSHEMKDKAGSEGPSQMTPEEHSIVERIRNTLKESEVIRTPNTPKSEKFVFADCEEQEDNVSMLKEETVESMINAKSQESKPLSERGENSSVQLSSRDNGWRTWRPPTLDVSDEVGEFWPPPKDTAEHLEEMMKREGLSMVCKENVSREIKRAIPVQEKNTPKTDESSISFSAFIRKMLSEVGRNAAVRSTEE